MFGLLAADGVSMHGAPCLGKEVLAMASTRLGNGQVGHLRRDFEFSRLQEEWMASVYALIVQSGQCRHHLGLSSAVAAAGPQSPHDAAIPKPGGQV